MPKVLPPPFPNGTIVSVPNSTLPVPKGRKTILGRITSSDMNLKKDGYLYYVWFAAFVQHDKQTQPEEILYNSRSQDIKFVKAPDTATLPVAAPTPNRRGSKTRTSVPEPVAVRRSERKTVIQGFHCICLCYITFCIRWRRKNPIPQQNVQKGKAMAFHHLILKPRLQQYNR
jgi:hypothetical protein